MQKRGKTALTLVGFAVMLAALLALMASIGARKDGFDIDEFFTYGLANSYHQPFLNTETGHWISGKAFSDYLTASGHAHEYLNVYENQIADVHPPLYYLFVHAVCSVFRNPPFTKWTGIGLNLFFFSLTQLGLLLLSARLLSDGERLTLTPSALLPGLLYGLGAGAASSVVFIRMYAMMTMWAVWLALALAARRFYPRAIAWPRKLKDVTFGIWVGILVLIAANASYDISSREGISERVLEQIGVMALLVCGFNFGLGYLLGGRTRAAECSQALGQKNTTLSIYLALTYASPIAALGPTFYVLWHNLWNAWQLYRVSERKRRDG